MRSRPWTRSVSAALAVITLAGCAKPRPALPTFPSYDPVAALRTDLAALLDLPGHQRGVWGVVVHSLERDERLYERNPRTLLVPASALKLVTAASAAEAVGWNAIFETRLVTTGRVEGGALHGDLVVVGSGDPTILGRAGAGPVEGIESWIEAVRRRGITRIEGRVVADDDALQEPRPGNRWSWEDLGYPYGAIPGALNLAENRVAVTVSPGAAEGLPTLLELPGHARGTPILNRSVTAGPGVPAVLWPEVRPGEATSIAGVIGAGDAPVRVPVSVGNPTRWFARALRNTLLSAGIDVTGDAVDADDLAVKPVLDGTTLHVHRSRPLADIARTMVKDSINLHAEAMLWLAAGPNAPLTTAAGLDATRARLVSWGVPEDGVQMVDGSGLSRRNVIAAEALATVLRRFHDPSGASPWMQAIPVAGREGTLAHRMKGTPAEGNALAKTGSMSNVRALAGYVRTADGEPLAFVLLANNFEGTAAAATAAIDAVVVRLASFSRTPPATR